MDRVIVKQVKRDRETGDWKVSVAIDGKEHFLGYVNNFDEGLRLCDSYVYNQLRYGASEQYPRVSPAVAEMGKYEDAAASSAPVDPEAEPVLGRDDATLMRGGWLLRFDGKAHFINLGCDGGFVCSCGKSHKWAYNTLMRLIKTGHYINMALVPEPPKPAPKPDDFCL